MEYRRLGRSGVLVSEIGLGGNTFGRFADERQTAAIIHRALDLGINHFDTADLYNQGASEEFIGKALADRRDKAIIATKTGFPLDDGPNGKGLSYRRIIACLEASLRRLGTDYVDVYYLHLPDRLTPNEESLRAIDDLIRAGKVRYAACSNYAGWEVVEMAHICDKRGYAMPVVSQSPYNLLDRGIEAELIPACNHLGMNIVPFSPLAGGFLTGKYRRGEPVPAGTRGADNPTWQQRFLTERNFNALEALEGFAKERGRTVGELAVAWLLAQPSVCSVIAGVTRPEQVDQNVAAAEWVLDADDLIAINDLLAQAGA